MPRGPATTASVAVLALLAVWQLVAVGPMSGSPLPAASDTFAALGAALVDPAFWRSVGGTLFAAAAGLALAIVVGVPLGVAVATSPVAEHATRVVVEFLKPIPPIVILPLVVLLVGPTVRMGVVLVFFGCVFPILTQTTAGVDDADPVALDTGRSFALSRSARIGRIVLPGAIPFIATGVRIAAAVALIVAVVSELIGGAPGLGQSLYVAQSAGQYPQLYAYVFFLGMVGVIINAAIVRLERHILHWHPSVRGKFA